MGLFDRIKKGVKSFGGKIAKGIKRGAKVVTKGVKRVVTSKFMKDFVKGFKIGFGAVGKLLQKPEEWIRKHDPLGKKMGSFGAFSPISLGSAILLAPITGIGYLEQAMVDKKLQKKIREGNPDEIMNLTFSALALVPLGAGSKILKEGQKKLVKPVVNGISKASLKSITKSNVLGYANSVIKNLQKSSPQVINKILPKINALNKTVSI